MSGPGAAKYKVYILGATCAALISMTAWGIVDLITQERAAREETKKKVDDLHDIVIGFVSKQSQINDHTDKTHEDISKRLQQVERKVNDAEIELYKITGRRLSEYNPRSAQKTEYEKIIETFTK